MQSRATDERLTTRLGCHNLNELIQRLTRCSAQTAARLERAQRAVAPTWDMITGEERPARLPALRAALLEGHIGADGVLAVAGPLLEMDRRVAREKVLLADEVIAAHARGEGPDAEPPPAPMCCGCTPRCGRPRSTRTARNPTSATSRSAADSPSAAPATG